MLRLPLVPGGWRSGSIRFERRDARHPPGLRFRPVLRPCCLVVAPPPSPTRPPPWSGFLFLRGFTSPVAIATLDAMPACPTRFAPPTGPLAGSRRA